MEPPMLGDTFNHHFPFINNDGLRLQMQLVEVILTVKVSITHHI